MQCKNEDIQHLDSATHKTEHHTTITAFLIRGEKKGKKKNTSALRAKLFTKLGTAQVTEQATGWTTKKSQVNSWQRQDISLFQSIHTASETHPPTC